MFDPQLKPESSPSKGSSGIASDRTVDPEGLVDDGHDEPVASEPAPDDLEPTPEPEPAGPTIRLSEEAKAAGDACVQCGLCLPACPTYLELGDEADSPRGRIRLMLGLHDGDVPYTDAAGKHIERCLGCLSCATACPSGVDYGTLLDDAVYKLSHDRLDGGPPAEQLSGLKKAIAVKLLARPNRLRVALAGARLADRVGLRRIARKVGLMKLMGPTLRRMDQLLPIDEKAAIWAKPMPAHSRAGGMDMVVRMLDPEQAEQADSVNVAIGFFEGCVAGVMSADVHQMAAEIMCEAGADVIAPPDQVCCGAIHNHAGDRDDAKDLARRNIDTFIPDDKPRVRYITNCTAGDGAMLREYGHLLADDAQYAGRAKTFAGLVRDITEVLLDLGVGEGELAFGNAVKLKAAYHDACHLKHAQGVATPPRQLLSRVPELELIDLPESDICCGAAGTYNLTQPEMAGRLARRKLEHFANTGADVLVSGNIGCTMHLAAIASEAGRPIKIVHPVELVHAAMFGRG
ncbi:MAG: heterodisulfide reductase-related iron-sulfur binding cluster [Planctomycetota bacterium]